MFRRVDLVERVLGRPLHCMPGRHAAIERVWHQVSNAAVCAQIVRIPTKKVAPQARGVGLGRW